MSNQTSSGNSTDSPPNTVNGHQTASQIDQNPMQTNEDRSNDKYKLKCSSIRKLIKEMIFHNGALDMKLTENCKEITKLKRQREYCLCRLVEYEKFDLSALRSGEQPEDKQTKKVKKRVKSIDEVKNEAKKTKVKCNKKAENKKTEWTSELKGDPKLDQSNEAGDLKKDLKKVKSSSLKVDKNPANKNLTNRNPINKNTARNSPKNALKSGSTKANQPKNSQTSQLKSATAATSLSTVQTKEFTIPITRIVSLPANDTVITTRQSPTSKTQQTTSNLDSASLRSSSLLVSNVPNCNTSSLISSSTSSSPAGSSFSSSIGGLPSVSTDLQSGHLQISLRKGNLTGSKILSGNGILAGVNKIQVSSLANGKLLTAGNVITANKHIAAAPVNKPHPPSSNAHEPIISNLLTANAPNSNPSNLSSATANLLSANGLLPNGGIVTINSHSSASSSNSGAPGNSLKSPANHSPSTNLLRNSVAQNGILNKNDVRIIINNQPLGSQSFVIRPVNLSDRSLFANKIVKNISVSNNGTGVVESGGSTGDELPNESLKLTDKTVLNNSSFYLNQKSDLVQGYVNLNEPKAGLINLNDLDSKNGKALSFGLIV